MLKKILKYDLQNVFKFLIFFYSLALFFATLTRIFFQIENSLIMNILAQICSGVTISMIFNILINNLMRIWIRFKTNFYSDESYLTHTLPIKKSILYLSKFLMAVISLFTSTLVLGLTIFIAYYSKENINLLKEILLPVANMYNSSVIKIIIALLFIFFLELANVIQSGYTGIILGHQMNNAKVGFSVLFGFITYIGTQVIVLLIIYITALFNHDLMNLFYTTEIVNLEMVKIIIYLAIFTYVITLVLGYLINIKLFNKGVNVE